MLLVVELVLTPTLGLLGGLGVIMMMSGLALAIVPASVVAGGGAGGGAGGSGAAAAFVPSLLAVGFGFLIGLVGVVYLTARLGHLPLFRHLVLDDSGVTHAIADDEASSGPRPSVGDAGRVTVPLRPAGRADFGAGPVDVVSTGRYLDIDTPVRVVAATREIRVEQA